MYPSLAPFGSRSRWYTKKQTQQEIVEELTYLEERLHEKQEKIIQVSIPILIRGQLRMPTKISTVAEPDDQEDDLEEAPPNQTEDFDFDVDVNSVHSQERYDDGDQYTSYYQDDQEGQSNEDYYPDQVGDYAYYGSDESP